MCRIFIVFKLATSIQAENVTAGDDDEIVTSNMISTKIDQSLQENM